MPKSRPKASTSSAAIVDSCFEVPSPRTSCKIVFKTSKGESDENPATVATYNVELVFERSSEGPWKFELLHGKAQKGNYLIVRPSFDKDENIYRDALLIQGEKWDVSKKYTLTPEGLVIHRVVFWKLTSQVGQFRLMASSDDEVVISDPFSVGSRRPGTTPNSCSSDTEENVPEEQDEAEFVTETPRKRKRTRSGKSSRKKHHSTNATANTPETATIVEHPAGDDAISQTITPVLTQVIEQVIDENTQEQQQEHPQLLNNHNHNPNHQQVLVNEGFEAQGDKIPVSTFWANAVRSPTIQTSPNMRHWDKQQTQVWDPADNHSAHFQGDTNMLVDGVFYSPFYSAEQSDYVQQQLLPQQQQQQQQQQQFPRFQTVNNCIIDRNTQWLLVASQADPPLLARNPVLLEDESPF